jgi:TusA-related sulfurtransferase
MRQGLPFTLLADDPLAGTDVPAIARLQGWVVALRSNEGDLLRFDLEPGNSAHHS